LWLTTGMRRGEAVGLRWADIDLDRGVLSVRRAIASVDGAAVEMEPKTQKGRRAIALDPATVDALRKQRDRQSAQRELAGGQSQAPCSPIRMGAPCILTT